MEVDILYKLLRLSRASEPVREKELKNISCKIIKMLWEQ